MSWMVKRDFYCLVCELTVLLGQLGSNFKIQFKMLILVYFFRSLKTCAVYGKHTQPNS